MRVRSAVAFTVLLLAALVVPGTGTANASTTCLNKIWAQQPLIQQHWYDGKIKAWPGMKVASDGTGCVNQKIELFLQGRQVGATSWTTLTVYTFPSFPRSELGVQHYGSPWVIACGAEYRTRVDVNDGVSKTGISARHC